MALTVNTTPGERLLVGRLRKGLTQPEMAKEFGVHVNLYRAWENDHRDGAPSVSAALGKIRDNEVCRILRKRSGKTQREVATESGMSRLWVFQLERGLGPVLRLASFWGIR